MHRYAVAVVCLFVFVIAEAQTVQSSPPSPASDPAAVLLAKKAVAALTGGASVSDVTLTASVTSVYGSDYETGTATFSAKGLAQSRVDLNLNGGTRSDVRNRANGLPSGAWSQNGAPSTAYGQHNCWTDAAWFFPALSSLAQTGNPNFVFKYLGQEQYGGMTTQHIRVAQIVSSDTTGTLQRLSETEFYLDAMTNVPDAITTNTHPDHDMGSNIPLEVRFASYQSTNRVLVPMHFQQMLNGGVVLDAQVTNAVFNTGLLDSQFILP